MQAASYIQLVEGRAPSGFDVDDFFEGMPPGKTAVDKFTIGLFADDDIVGCADVIRAYPDSACAFIGLLLFAETHQGRGYGKAALGLIDEMVRRWGCTRMRLAVVSSNRRAFSFWQREGFETLYRVNNERFLGELIVMERPLA
ncbi:GNAT family N-acetyltransferase [Trinickia sp. NRRL B-1857]|uniref:GNAT family N-acetyltransferase n=1 Tax=Trinickia sp. NRRL B-1857 TaxID=3162879 RepID=UPI003D2E518D